MEEREKVEMNSDACARCAQGMHSGYCGHWHGGRHIFLRMLLMLVILLVTFGVGFKLGEFKGSFGRDSFFGGRDMMYRRAPYMKQGYNMMGSSRPQRFIVPAPQIDTLPVAPTPTK